jgi:type IV secretory pathway VirB10-like protein
MKARSRLKTVSFEPMRVFTRNSIGEIPEGSKVRAKLLSTVLPSTLVSAVLTDNLMIDGDKVIPKGSKVFGVSSEMNGRMKVVFKKVILPSREKFEIKAMAHRRRNGSMGLKGSKVGPNTLKALASTGMYFISGLSEGLIERQVSGVNGERVTMKAILKNGLMHGASKASIEQSRQILAGLKNRQSVLKVSKGRVFSLVFYNLEEEFQ